MGITGSRAAVLSNFVDFKIKYQKQRRISNELKELAKKYNVSEQAMLIQLINLKLPANQTVK